MDKESSHSESGSGGDKSQKSRSSSPTQPGDVSGSGRLDVGLIAQPAAPAGSGTDLNQYLSQQMNSNTQPPMNPVPEFYNLFQSMRPGHPPLSLLSSANFSWSDMLAHQQGQHSSFDSQHHAGTIPTIPPMHFDSPLYNVLPPLPIDNTGSELPSLQPGQQFLASRSESSSPSGDTDPTDVDRGAIAEEKRRRNTAASARFRIKKKQRTINLERSVSDLTGRAEELEREVADLQRENGWLKDIVMLKGARFAVANTQQRFALSQAVQAAGISLHLEPVENASQPGASSSTQLPSNMEGAQCQEEKPSDEDHEDTDKKGKGKGPAVKEKRG